jgi:FKBP-type peptidyl-prolyl cis-trans isomerase SlyD
MAEKIKVGDFISLDYTAKLASNDMVFDTTIESDAKKYNIYNKDVKYKPLVVKVGAGHLVKGLDNFLVDKVPSDYTVELDSENAFGKKNAKLLRLISIKEFFKNEIRPVPGLEVELDGNRGVVRTVSGGRVIVDFNHPLSSQDVTYTISIKGIVTEPNLKVEAALEVFKIPFENVTTDANKVIVKFKTEIPKEISETIIAELKKLTDVSDIEFK